MAAPVRRRGGSVGAVRRRMAAARRDGDGRVRRDRHPRFAGHGAARRLFRARVLRHGARRHRHGAGRRHGRSALLPGQLDARPRRVLPSDRARRARPRARRGRARSHPGGLRRRGRAGRIRGSRHRHSGHDGHARARLHRLCRCDRRAAAAVRIHRQVRAPDSGAQSAGWRRPRLRLGFASRPDPVRTGGPHRHDARRHPRVLGCAGSGRAARAADRNGAGRRAPDSLRNPDDPGRAGHALHAGHGAVAARASGLYPRRSWFSGQAAEGPGGPT